MLTQFSCPQSISSTKYLVHKSLLHNFDVHNSLIHNSLYHTTCVYVFGMCFGSGLNLSEVIECSVAWSVDRSRWSWKKKKALEVTNVPSWLLKKRSLTHRPQCLQAVVTTVTTIV
ncbi:unnamed protein product [Brassica napus]|uniref:(rape) hypothetical protein n=1 Tax=Brassica napus TaxID=3708 RepID=A0A816JBG6_BRANA|nr:unnamed protein product [Brassica napus]